MTVDRYVERYNKASGSERVRLKKTNLHRALSEKGLIRSGELLESDRVKSGRSSLGGSPGKRTPILPLLILAFLLIGSIVLLSSFHIVYDVPTLVAKDGVTFADTFITVDSYLDRYNSASRPTQIHLEQTNLHRRLEEKGLMTIVVQGSP